MAYTQQPKWYYKRRNVILVLIFLFPLGFYYMGKYNLWDSRLLRFVTGCMLGLYIQGGKLAIDEYRNPGEIEISAEEASAYVEDLASEVGQGILETYQYSYGEEFKIFIYFTGNESANSACLFVVRDNKLELFKYDCGEYCEKQFAYNDFIEGLN